MPPIKTSEWPLQYLVSAITEISTPQSKGRANTGVAQVLSIMLTIPLARAQAPRLRQALVTIGVRVVRSVRRIVLHLPRSHPEQEAWQQVAQRLGAT